MKTRDFQVTVTLCEFEDGQFCISQLADDSYSICESNDKPIIRNGKVRVVVPNGTTKDGVVNKELVWVELPEETEAK